MTEFIGSSHRDQIRTSLITSGVSILGDGDRPGNRPDILRGLAGDDYLAAGGGDDRLFGGVDNDILLGGSGDDELRGGSGDDYLGGGRGNDLLLGGGSSDLLKGDAGNDLLRGGSGDDQVEGGSGDDAVFGGSGDDYLLGDSGDDVLDGGTGVDGLFGELGDDILIIRSGEAMNDILSGGSGFDTLRIDAAAGPAILTGLRARGLEALQGGGQALIGTRTSNFFDLSGFQSIERLEGVFGRGGGDRLVGSRFDDLLDGGFGDDQIDGGAGEDVVFGGAGDDTFLVGGRQARNDNFDGGPGVDTLQVDPSRGKLVFGTISITDVEIYAGAGLDVRGTTRGDVIDFSVFSTIAAIGIVRGGGGADEITSGIGVGEIRGGAGDDTLRGSSGVETLRGGADDDVFLIGGSEAQDDTIIGGPGEDRIVILPELGDLVLRSFTSREVEFFEGSGALVRGTGGNDTIDFSVFDVVSGLNEIRGRAGNDELTGGVGEETVRGGPGTDRIHGSLGADTLHGGANDDWFIFGEKVGPEGIAGDTIQYRRGDTIDLTLVNGSDSVDLIRKSDNINDDSNEISFEIGEIEEGRLVASFNISETLEYSFVVEIVDIEIDDEFDLSIQDDIKWKGVAFEPPPDILI